MSIHKLIDTVAKCVQCGAPKSTGCPCWVRLECPCCGRSMTVPRDDTDPTSTAVVVFACPDCQDSEPEDMRYFDVNGNELFEEDE